MLIASTTGLVGVCPSVWSVDPASASSLRVQERPIDENASTNFFEEPLIFAPTCAKPLYVYNVIAVQDSSALRDKQNRA